MTKRPGEDRILRLPTVDLTFIRVDHQTRLQLETTEVVIETPFELQVGDTTYHLDPGERAGLG